MPLLYPVSDCVKPRARSLDLEFLFGNGLPTGQPLNREQRHIVMKRAAGELLGLADDRLKDDSGVDVVEPRQQFDEACVR